MREHEIALDGYRAAARERVLTLGTAGSRGVERLRVTAGRGWEGMQIQLVFHPCGVAMQLPEDGAVDVPWEATAEALESAEGKIVFQGFSGGKLVNSTDVSYKVLGHSGTVGRDEKPYTPGVVEAVLEQVKAQAAGMNAAADRAEAAAQRAEAAVEGVDELVGAAVDAAVDDAVADAVGEAVGQAETAAQRAEAAAGQVQEAAANMGEIVDAALEGAVGEAIAGALDAAGQAQAAASQAAASAGQAGQVLGQLDQMLEDGPVASVNGKTGLVSLAAADVGAAPAPAAPQAGQLLVVEAVNGDGTFTVKCMEMPTGGGFTEMSESLPAGQREENTLYFLETGTADGVKSGELQNSAGTKLSVKTRAADCTGADGTSMEEAVGGLLGSLAAAQGELEQLGGELEEAQAALAALEDAPAGAQTVRGTYQGTGGYGSSSRNSLTFDFVPDVLVVAAAGYTKPGTSGGYPYGGSSAPYLIWTGQPGDAGETSASAGQCAVSVTGTTVRWYNASSAANQLNERGMTYYYFAAGKE